MRVLFGVDGSQHAELAWKFYIDNIHREDSDVILCHSMEVPFQSFQPIRAEILDDILKEVRQEATKVMDKFVKHCNDKHITHQVVSDFDRPGELLVRTANNEKANLIIMGTRGMGAVRRTILGSVSDYVVHHAHCPVMICRH